MKLRLRMESAKTRKLKTSGHDCFASYECKAEYITQELKGKLRNLNFRLLDCQNQNQMLRKELLLAKKVVNTEISPVAKEDFKELLNQANFRGRREKIMVLKEKLSELQNRIKELEDVNTDKSSADPVTTAKVDKLDKKIFQNKQMIDRELQYLLENSCQLKRKIEVWKKRNAEISKEIELLRLELDRLLEKSEEDKTVHESYRLVDKELRARQTDKLDLRKKLDLQKTRNEQLVEELAGLKEDHSMILSKINDDKVLIDALNNQQGYLLDLLERQKMISETDNRKFQDDLREIQAKHATNSHILDHLTDIVEEKSQKCLQLQKSVKEKEAIEDSDVSTVTTITTDSELTQPSNQSLKSDSQPSSASASEPPSGDEEPPSEIDIEMEKLTEECQQYKDVLRSMDEEVEQLTNSTSINREKMNEWRKQLFQTRSLLAQRNAEIRDLEDTAKKLQKATVTSKKDAPSAPQGANFVEEMLKTNDVLNEEYQFLLSMWNLLISNKENSLEVLSTAITCRKQFLIDNIDEVISELDMPEAEEKLPLGEEEAAQISKTGEE